MIKRHELFDIIPEEEIERVFSYEYCELSYDFMGFTDVYKALSAIIPLHYTIIDLGCYAAAQSYYFLRHKQYIGVDVFNGERFITPNSVHYIKSIQEFCSEDTHYINLDESFAICSYVPDFSAVKIAKRIFKNLFVYYPAGIDREFSKMINEVMYGQSN